MHSLPIFELPIPMFNHTSSNSYSCYLSNVANKLVLECILIPKKKKQKKNIITSVSSVLMIWQIHNSSTILVILRNILLLNWKDHKGRMKDYCVGRKDWYTLTIYAPLDCWTWVWFLIAFKSSYTNNQDYYFILQLVPVLSCSWILFERSEFLQDLS